jgi:hypothetical protein
MTMIFEILSILVFLSLSIGKMFFFNHENIFVKEKSLAITIMLFVLYTVFCIVSLFFVSIPAKIILVLCGISPFIIGHFATYKKLNYYTMLQLMVILAGFIYAYGKGLTN